MGMKGQDRDPKKERVAALLATGATVKATARKAGVGERTVYKWLAIPEFQAAVRTQRNRVVDRIVGRLVRSADLAITALCKSVKGEESDAVRVRAADVLLSHLNRLREHQELAEQVRELQEKLEGQSCDR
jgi:transposase-like protein